MEGKQKGIVRMSSTVGDRINRGQYARVWATTVAVTAPLYVLFLLLGDHGLANVVGLVFLAVGFINLFRTVDGTICRLHDIGLTGWFWPLLFVPLVNVVMVLALLVLPGQPAPNRYGLVPGPRPQ